VIITNIPRVVYYAGGEYVSIPPGIPTEKLVHRGKWKKADYLIIEEKKSSLSKALTPFEQNGQLKLIHRHHYGDKGRVISVYKIRKQKDRP
jgi:hypothetical protein